MDYIIYIGCSAQASGLEVEMDFGKMVSYHILYRYEEEESGYILEVIFNHCNILGNHLQHSNNNIYTSK
jgi:hypothetical protein